MFNNLLFRQWINAENGFCRHPLTIKSPLVQTIDTFVEGKQKHGQRNNCTKLVTCRYHERQHDTARMGLQSVFMASKGSINYNRLCRLLHCHVSGFLSTPYCR